jgi:hypothetical protein
MLIKNRHIGHPPPLANLLLEGNWDVAGLRSVSVCAAAWRGKIPRLSFVKVLPKKTFVMIQKSGSQTAFDIWLILLPKFAQVASNAKSTY